MEKKLVSYTQYFKRENSIIEPCLYKQPQKNHGDAKSFAVRPKTMEMHNQKNVDDDLEVSNGFLFYDLICCF